MYAFFTGKYDTTIDTTISKIKTYTKYICTAGVIGGVGCIGYIIYNRKSNMNVADEYKSI